MRRDYLDHNHQRRDLYHLSDVETSDSTRPPTERRSVQGNQQITPLLVPSAPLATVSHPRVLYQADADRVSRELLRSPSAFQHTGARPKQTVVAPPTVPEQRPQQASSEHVTVTQAVSHKSHSATSSISSRGSRAADQDLHFQNDAKDLLESLDEHLSLIHI